MTDASSGMMQDLRQILVVLAVGLFVLYYFILWVLTFLAFRQRFKAAHGNLFTQLFELIKFLLAPLYSPIIWVLELLYWIFKKLSPVLLILLSPIWILMLGLLLLALFLPDIIDRLLRNIGILGDRILNFNEQFPTRVARRSHESLASLLGNMALFLSNTPLNILITNGKAVNTLEALGLRTKAISIFKSIAIDSNQGLRTRLNAVRSLARMDLTDDLIDIVRSRGLTPEVARSIAARLQEKEQESLDDADKSLVYNQAHLLSWRLLTRHRMPVMRLEAARKLQQEGLVGEARRVFLNLSQDKSLIHETRCQAVDELGFMTPDPETLAGLHLLQNDADLNVRLSASEAAARLENPEPAVAEICKYLDVNQNPAIRKQAIQTLGKLNRRYELVSICKNTQLNPEDRFEACLAILNSGRERLAFASMLRLVLAEDYPLAMRVKALRELGHTGKDMFADRTSFAFQRAQPLLFALGEEETTPGVLRFGVAQAFENMGFENEANTLYIFLSNPKNPEKGIRNLAAQALKALKARA